MWGGGGGGGAGGRAESERCWNLFMESPLSSGSAPKPVSSSAVGNRLTFPQIRARFTCASRMTSPLRVRSRVCCSGSVAMTGIHWRSPQPVQTQPTADWIVSTQICALQGPCAPPHPPPCSLFLCDFSYITARRLRTNLHFSSFFLSLFHSPPLLNILL